MTLNDKIRLAQDPNASAKILSKLAKDEDYYVREAVARNPNCPPEIISKPASGDTELPILAAPRRLIGTPFVVEPTIPPGTERTVWAVLVQDTTGRIYVDRTFDSIDEANMFIHSAIWKWEGKNIIGVYQIPF